MSVPGLALDSFTFDDGDVAVDREVGEALDRAAGGGPFDFQPVDLRLRPDSQNFPWVMRGEVTSPAGLQARTLQVAGLPSENGSDGVTIRFSAHQTNSQPMVFLS